MSRLRSSIDRLRAEIRDDLPCPACTPAGPIEVVRMTEAEADRRPAGSPTCPQCGQPKPVRRVVIVIPGPASEA